MAKTLARALIAACAVISQCAAASINPTWQADIRNQTNRPRLEARYVDATRTALVIEAQAYSLTINMTKPDGQRVSSLKVNTTGKPTEITSGGGIYLEMTDAKGVIYSSLNSKAKSRINIYRRGPYYIETHWLDVELVDKTGKAAPIKGEVVFYSYPEKCHVGAILHVTDNVRVKSAQVILELTGKGWSVPVGEVRSMNAPSSISRFDAGKSPTAALIYPSAENTDYVSIIRLDSSTRVANFIYSDIRHNGAVAEWAKNSKQAAYFEILPIQPGSDAREQILLESNPILTASARAYEGRYLGYDPIRGCYTVETDSIGWFNEHFKNPNAYERATFALRNGPVARKIYVLHATRKNPGVVECGVVLDDQDYTLPITVQISKNFDGEEEEPFYNPGDTAFSETIFPLCLAPNERRALTSLHLYENWGNHRLKQFSSLGAWMDYYHMSTGVTETTCYVPFNFSGLPGVSIADFRGMSQRYWGSQPQHDNVAGHSFLRYQDPSDTWHYVEYTGTEFRSTGPNWADMSMSYLSDDGKAKVKIDVFEMPQTDELRNFIHMRVDFLKDIAIKDGDLARNCRLLNIASWVQGMRYTHLAYGGPTGEPTVVPIKLDDNFTVAGAPLPRKHGYAVIYPDKRGANAYVIRDSKCKIGGKDASLGVSLIGWKTEGPYRNPGDTILMLVPATDAKEIKAGDYIDIDMFLMPYGGGTQTPEPVLKAVQDYSVSAPKVTAISRGMKLADFPTRVALDAAGKAEFSVSGGFDAIPIIVEGAKDYRRLRLYSVDNGTKTLVNLSQPETNDGYQVFARPDGTFGWVFLYKTDGKEHKFIAE